MQKFLLNTTQAGAACRDKRVEEVGTAGHPLGVKIHAVGGVVRAATSEGVHAP